MNDRLDTYRQRFAAEQPDEFGKRAGYSRCADDVVERSILARRIGRHPALDAPYGDHPLDRLTDRMWRATIRTACFIGKFITAAAIGVILGRLFT